MFAEPFTFVDCLNFIFPELVNVNVTFKTEGGAVPRIKERKLAINPFTDDRFNSVIYWSRGFLTRLIEAKTAAAEAVRVVITLHIFC